MNHYPDSMPNAEHLGVFWRLRAGEYTKGVRRDQRNEKRSRGWVLFRMKKVELVRQGKIKIHQLNGRF